MKINCHAYNEKRCQSCSLIEQDYEVALKNKVSRLEELFPKDKILTPLKTSELQGYRNKAKFVIGGSLDQPVIGIPGVKDKFSVSPLLDCLLHHEDLNEVASFIFEHIKEFKLTPYSVEEKKGEFKYLILSIGRNTNDISIRFGMRSSESRPRVGKLLALLQEKFANVKVVSFEIQSKHAAIFEGETHYLTENRYIEHDFDDFQLKGSTTNFFQVNSEVAKSLYEKVFQRYKDESIDVAIDLFCGVGGFAQSVARFAKKVIGIEISQNAIECAKELAAKNIEFFCDDALKFPNYYQGNVDLLVVNPPRRGIGEQFSKHICEISPKYFVYSSCNPQTLKKDAEIFSEFYELESITPVDMFALTDHLEVLSFWKRK
jgi:23S rRNA (uracil747-C5)-methyltransferase